MSYYLTQKFPNPGLSTQTIVIIVLSVVVFILSVGIIVYFVYFFPKRKKRANELADDYEYQAKEETKDKLMVNE
jgi:flagellar basal body-associated protein FliL